MQLTDKQIRKKWYWIQQAKYNPNSPDYHYAHRLKLGFGSYQEFKEHILDLDMPTEEYKYLHRIDQKKGWVPGNLVLATGKQAGNNRKSAHKITYMGMTKTKVQWAEHFNICYWTLHRRLMQGLPLEQAIQVRKRKGKYSNGMA